LFGPTDKVLAGELCDEALEFEKQEGAGDLVGGEAGGVGDGV